MERGPAGSGLAVWDTQTPRQRNATQEDGRRRLSDAPSQRHTRRPDKEGLARGRGQDEGEEPWSLTTLTDSRTPAPSALALTLGPGSPAGSPISSSSEVMDLERREMAGGGSRLACWGAKKGTVGGVRPRHRGEKPRDPPATTAVLPEHGEAPPAARRPPCLSFSPEGPCGQAASGKGRPGAWRAPESRAGRRQRRAGRATQPRRLTFLVGGLVHVRVPGDHHHLHHQRVAPLADHVHHLAVAHLHHILPVHLRHRHPPQPHPGGEGGVLSASGPPLGVARGGSPPSLGLSPPPSVLARPHFLLFL